MEGEQDFEEICIVSWTDLKSIPKRAELVCCDSRELSQPSEMFPHVGYSIVGVNSDYIMVNREPYGSQSAPILIMEMRHEEGKGFFHRMAIECFGLLVRDNVIESGSAWDFGSFKFHFKDSLKATTENIDAYKGSLYLRKSNISTYFQDDISNGYLVQVPLAWSLSTSIIAVESEDMLCLVRFIHNNLELMRLENRPDQHLHLQDQFQFNYNALILSCHSDSNKIQDLVMYLNTTIYHKKRTVNSQPSRPNHQTNFRQVIREYIYPFKWDYENVLLPTIKNLEISESRSILSKMSNFVRLFNTLMTESIEIEESLILLEQLLPELETFSSYQHLMSSIEGNASIYNHNKAMLQDFYLKCANPAVQDYIQKGMFWRVTDVTTIDVLYTCIIENGYDFFMSHNRIDPKSELQTSRNRRRKQCDFMFRLKDYCLYKEEKESSLVCQNVETGSKSELAFDGYFNQDSVVYLGEDIYFLCRCFYDEDKFKCMRLSLKKSDTVSNEKMDEIHLESRNGGEIPIDLDNDLSRVSYEKPVLEELFEVEFSYKSIMIVFGGLRAKEKATDDQEVGAGEIIQSGKKSKQTCILFSAISVERTHRENGFGVRFFIREIDGISSGSH